MSAPLTGRERYEWLVPGASKGEAHAFILGARDSICLKMARFPFNKPAMQREQLAPGEPRRKRCDQCLRILGRDDNKGMVEVNGA
jgi:hypothetical protein